MQKSIVRYKICGNENKPTIYYLTGYGGRVWQYRPHIVALVASGFRVVAFEYDRAILAEGNPQLLLDAVKEVTATINKDKSGRIVAGAYCVSLGSWIGLNASVVCDLERNVHNTGGVSIINTIWYNKLLRMEKKALEENNYSKKSLQKIWGKLDLDNDGGRFAGKQIIMMSSTGDKIMNISEVRRNVRGWQEDGVKVMFIVSRGLNHPQTIIRNMFRFRKVVRFFKSTQLD